VQQQQEEQGAERTTAPAKPVTRSVRGLYMASYDLVGASSLTR
jgi:hypothetical protein